jgi:hypothetical protein
MVFLFFEYSVYDKSRFLCERQVIASTCCIRSRNGDIYFIIH